MIIVVKRIDFKVELIYKAIVKELLESITNLKNSEISNLVDSRMKEFAEIKNKSIDVIFKELCFCIMTANCAAEKCIEIQQNIGSGFLDLTELDLSKKFKELGYRFPNIRSKFIVEARTQKPKLKEILKDFEIGNELRDWIVKNVKGIGYKEGSHFLRNIGFKNYAIVDFHIVDLLTKYNIIEKPKTMTKKKYLEIEEMLKEIGKQLNLSLAELDLYLWYMETGKILK